MSRIRCDECAKYFNLVDDFKYSDWISLVNFVQFLDLEEYIEHQTYEEMFGKLLTFKPWATEEPKAKFPTIKEFCKLLLNTINIGLAPDEVRPFYEAVKNEADS